MDFSQAKIFYDIFIPLVWLSMNRMLDFPFIFTQNFDVVPCILSSSITAKSSDNILVIKNIWMRLEISNPILRI